MREWAVELRTDILAGVDLHAALPRDDVSGLNELICRTMDGDKRFRSDPDDHQSR